MRVKEANNIQYCLGDIEVEKRCELQFINNLGHLKGSSIVKQMISKCLAKILRSYKTQW